MRDRPLLAAALLAMASIALMALMALMAPSAARAQTPASTDPAAWTAYGFTPADAAAWTHVGVGPAEAREWVRAGIPHAEWANQFRSEGFGAAEAGVWVAHEVTVHTAAQFRSAGFTAREATAWIAAGVRSALRATEFRDAGVGAAEAGTWWAQGFDAGDARPWRTAGFDADAAHRWKYGPTEYFYMRDGSRNAARETYPVEWAEAWRPTGLGPAAARLASGWGLEPLEMREWLSRDFTFDAAMPWRDFGYTPEEAAALRDAGLDPPEADANRRASVPPPPDLIHAWHADITLRPDATVSIVETIDMTDGPGGAIAGCLVHDMPARIDLPRTSRLSTSAWPSYAIDSVEIDGQPAPDAFRHDEAGDLSVCADGSDPGDLPAGRHTITFRYTTDDRLIDLHHRDRLVVSVISGDVTSLAPVMRASATVRLPRGANTARASGVAGPPGRQYFDVRVEETVDGDVLHYTVSRPLDEGMMFAVAVDLPKGFAVPGLWQKVRRLDRSQGRLLTSGLILLGGIGISVIYLLVAWHLVGRDPRRRAVTPRYDPPRGLTPALMRYLLDRQRVDERSVVATIVRLAQHGAIAIDAQSGVYTLRWIDLGTPGLAGHESRILKSLFDGRSTLPLGTRMSRRRLRAARAALRKELRAERDRYLATNTRHLWPGLALSAAGVVVALAVVSLPAEGFYAYGAFALVLLLAVNLPFVRLLKAPTPAGRALADAAAGFRLFLDSTYGESPGGSRLPSTDAPPVRADHLPFAIAHGAGAERAAVLIGDAPWLSGDSGGFSVADFTRSIRRSRPRSRSRMPPQAVQA